MKSYVKNVANEEHMRMKEEIKTLRDENDDIKVKLKKT